MRCKKRSTRLQVSCFVKISVKSKKKVYTSIGVLCCENIGEEQKKGLHFCRCPVFVKISVKSKKRFTRLQVFRFRKNVGEKQKKRAFRHIFLTVVSHYPPKNHILPLGGNLPPGWEPLLNSDTKILKSERLCCSLLALNW